MALKTIFWAGFFGLACIAAIWSPIWGVIGYMLQYSIGPQFQWWHAPLNPLHIRYSLVASIFIALGMLFNWGSLSYGKSLLHKNEKWMLLFLGIMFIVMMITPETVRYSKAWTDAPTEKIAKVLIFVFMMTHIATNAKNLDRLLWALVIGSLILGHKAWSTPLSSFSEGRLETVGGPDFRDANYFAGYMVGMLFIIGAQFMRSGLRGKIVCFLAGGFTANAIVLTRSRGAFLGVVVGLITAVILAPKKQRAKVLVGVVLVCLGGLYLSDAQFLNRASTITDSEEEQDASTSRRLDIWRGAGKMFLANPLGVGPGNFRTRIGEYAPSSPDWDAHNTIVRCAAELGILGILCFLIVVMTSLLLLHRTMRRAATLPKDVGAPILWASYGAMTGLVGVLTDGLTQTFIYTEFLWWFLALPLCISRTLDNLVIEHESSSAAADSQSILHEEPVPEPVGSH